VNHLSRFFQLSVPTTSSCFSHRSYLHIFHVKM
jgi:hypothetical protein